MFHFQLQTLLEARQAREEQKQMELAEALRELESQKAVLEDIRRKKRKMIQEYYDLTGKPIDGLSVSFYNANIVRCREIEILQEEKCRNAEKSMDEKREALIVAAKEKKALEKLKERKTMEYQLDEIKKESKELDESAILRYEGDLS